MITLLRHAKVFVDLVHSPRVEKNQCNKGDDGTLLREPESDIHTTNSYAYQDGAQEHGNAVGREGPHHHAPDDQAKVRLPVRLCYFFINHNAISACFCFSAMPHQSWRCKASGRN